MKKQYVISQVNDYYDLRGCCQAVITFRGSHFYGDIHNLPMKWDDDCVVLVDAVPLPAPRNWMSVLDDEREGGEIVVANVNDLSFLLIPNRDFSDSCSDSEASQLFTDVSDHLDSES